MSTLPFETFIKNDALEKLEFISLPQLSMWSSHDKQLKKEKKPKFLCKLQRQQNDLKCICLKHQLNV
ncbi:CLUMA_CG010783, isoform A [Clunio marinus]|uniref:CLUMA_CG010783, isoform A n=1 Tax=Clunio marinus TaxID=568069 RepID=A0A1J1IG20_9DIPT|nr:CLUMA_CG010783, isoform A [Clunio marinus]